MDNIKLLTYIWTTLIVFEELLTLKHAKKEYKKYEAKNDKKYTQNTNKTQKKHYI